MLPKFKSGKLDYDSLEDTNYYGGVQYSMGKHLIIGAAYNYFLLRDVTVNLTFFI